MDNLESTQKITQDDQSKKNSGPIIIIIVTFILVVLAVWQFSSDNKENSTTSEPLTAEADIPTPLPPEELEEKIDPIDLSLVAPIVEESTPEIITPEKEVIILPEIDNSDAYIQIRLPELTWRNELLSLLVTDDIIRRFVVFTDNFSQGLLAYEHSLFIQPKVKFSVDEKSLNVDGQENVWYWDIGTSKRFDRYVNLLRSVDSTILVDLYMETKPLIDEAYRELGYEDDFTYTLQDAITRVLDMELPQTSMNITRTSVMYKYQDPQLEGLDDSDKLLLRIGKENLLIIKSVLLEINEKLTKRISDNEQA
ncbi:MAG: DUF3014 domain-containing protein [Colwellia sp.]